MAVGRKTGGRQKGTPNKSNAQREADIQASGLTPLEYMLKVLRDDNETPDRRMWAAQQAGPYVHPKLAQVEAETVSKVKARIDIGWLPPE